MASTLTPSVLTSTNGGGVATEVERFMQDVVARNPNEPEFHQAVHEVAEIGHAARPERPALPRGQDPRTHGRTRSHDFLPRSTWEDDTGRGPGQSRLAHPVQRRDRSVQGRHAIPSRASRQACSNSLASSRRSRTRSPDCRWAAARADRTSIQRAKSDREVMRFCQSLMNELSRHIGERTDVPAGDIGVGAREMGYMFGAYRRARESFHGRLHREGPRFWRQCDPAGSDGLWPRLLHRGDARRTRRGHQRGKTATVSGSGNVALYCIEKLSQLGATVVTASDSSGFITIPTAYRARSWTSSGPQGSATRPNLRVCGSLQERQIHGGQAALEREV